MSGSEPMLDLTRRRWHLPELERAGAGEHGVALRGLLRARNAAAAPEHLECMARWDVAEYERPHLPVIVGELSDRKAFSAPSGLRLLDMAIRQPGGEWVLPEAIAQFREVLELAVACERAINPQFDSHYYAYFTVDQKRVEPGVAQRRVGWHGDAFISPETTQLELGPVWVDNTYVVSDALPTLFLPGPFSLKGIDATDIRAVLARFEELARGQAPVRHAPCTLVRMTPYDVHTPDINTSDRVLERTFVKIQFSRDRLNMLGNTLNRVEDGRGRTVFSYDGWTWIPRDPAQRNNRNSVLGWDRPDRAAFRLVTPSEVDFDGELPGVDWLEPRFSWARKVEGVLAEPALPDERLETVGRGAFRSSFNIAQPGDWKVTTSQGDQYFLSDARLRERYEVPPSRSACFVQPRGTPSRVARITEPVRYRSPWGAWAFAPAGSVLTRLARGDVYAILPENFAASYVACDESGSVLVEGGVPLGRARAERPGELIRVRDEPLDLSPPRVAVFDLHGTLTRPNWKTALARTFSALVGASDADAERWVRTSTWAKSDVEVLLELADAAGGMALEQVERAFQEQRRLVGRTEPMRAIEGVDEALEGLREREVALYVLTFAHTERERTLEQLEQAGLARYFAAERVLTSQSLPPAPDRARFRDAGLAHVASIHAGARLWFFNDTPDGLGWTRSQGGVAFGVPQGEGVDWDRRATPLVAGGAHVLVQDWRRFARVLGGVWKAE